MPSSHSSIDLAQLTAELDAQLLVDSHTGLIYIDLDDFGRLNQRLGIARADEVLFSIARAILGVCKTETHIFHRVLGDQFAVFVSGKRSVLETARKLMMEIRRASTLGVTASVGTVGGGGEDAEAMILRARYAAYLSKKNGKDRITDRSDDFRPVPAPEALGYSSS